MLFFPIVFCFLQKKKSLDIFRYIKEFVLVMKLQFVQFWLLVIRFALARKLRTTRHAKHFTPKVVLKFIFFILWVRYFVEQVSRAK